MKDSEPRVDTEQKTRGLLRRATNTTATLTLPERTQVASHVLSGLVSPDSQWSPTAKVFSYLLLPTLSHQGITAADVTQSYMAAYEVCREKIHLLTLLLHQKHSRHSF
jgi:hypothetical protein